jgi:hypothetical protein
MPSKKLQMCPLFPDRVCPKGKKASTACSVRINGDFDTVAYFKDLLLMHCAIHVQQKSNTVSPE